MTKQKIIILFSVSFLIFSKIFAQTDPVIAIDGVNTIFKSGLSLPYWLKSGQTVELVANVKSVSIVEFFGDSNSLKYSKVIHLTSSQTVPEGKVWKMEALGIGTSGQVITGFSNTTVPSIFVSPKVYSDSGNYNFIVPPGVTNICIEVWGGGGNGSGGYWNGQKGFMGSGGGGGGYGYQCFTVTPGSQYNVTVGGVAGTSSVGSLINATGGTNALTPSSYSSENGMLPSFPGQGGGSNATYNINGLSAQPKINIGGNGANGANGGLGGLGYDCYIYGSQNGNNGSAPGGGGGGGCGGCGWSGGSGGRGAQGKVMIYW